MHLALLMDSNPGKRVISFEGNENEWTGFNWLLSQWQIRNQLHVIKLAQLLQLYVIWLAVFPENILIVFVTN